MCSTLICMVFLHVKISILSAEVNHTYKFINVLTRKDNSISDKRYITKRYKAIHRSWTARPFTNAEPVKVAGETHGK